MNTNLKFYLDNLQKKILNKFRPNKENPMPNSDNVFDPIRTNPNLFSYHSRQGSATSGCTSRTGYSGTNSGTNHSTHSNISQASIESKNEGRVR